MLEFLYTKEIQNEKNLTLADCVTLLRLADFFLASDLLTYAENLMWNKLTPYIRKASTVHCFPSSVTNTMNRNPYTQINHPSVELATDSTFVNQFIQAVSLAYANSKANTAVTGADALSSAMRTVKNLDPADVMAADHTTRDPSSCPAAQVILADFTFAICGALMGTEILRRLNEEFPLFGSDVLGVMCCGMKSPFWLTKQLDTTNRPQQQGGLWAPAGVFNHHSSKGPLNSASTPAAATTTGPGASSQRASGPGQFSSHDDQQHQLCLSEFGVSSRKCDSCKRNWRYDWAPQLYDVLSLELRPTRAVCFACVTVQGHLPGWQPWKK
ncbi:hypothetical protein BD289DRAFT_74692 [Coniella lustricola]|uniref:Uncharacterized protein n=1 Tax=Coniella lustricola TaxID=2025994 RepID=A0A2T3AHM5_9PEZI|nr:hypothetical protein BD289DRAFT_74692 [Coniella lustricola]